MVGPLSHVLPRILGVKDTRTNTHKWAKRFPNGFNRDGNQEAKPTFTGCLNVDTDLFLQFSHQAFAVLCQAKLERSPVPENSTATCVVVGSRILSWSWRSQARKEGVRCTERGQTAFVQQGQVSTEGGHIPQGEPFKNSPRQTFL